MVKNKKCFYKKGLVKPPFPNETNIIVGYKDYFREFLYIKENMVLKRKEERIGTFLLNSARIPFSHRL